MNSRSPSLILGVEFLCTGTQHENVKPVLSVRTKLLQAGRRRIDRHEIISRCYHESTSKCTYRGGFRIIAIDFKVRYVLWGGGRQDGLWAEEVGGFPYVLCGGGLCCSSRTNSLFFPRRNTNRRCDAMRVNSRSDIIV